MKKFLILIFFGIGVLYAHDHNIHPAKISIKDAAGGIFERESTESTEWDNGNITLDVSTMLSSDKKFGTGMYSSGKTRMEITEPYGVDEFMFFLEGSVTLTSSDGTVTIVNAGEGISIPKEWTGIWETEGYRKIWVIYSADGSGL